jgi:hypothetical protein
MNSTQTADAADRYLQRRLALRYRLKRVEAALAQHDAWECRDRVRYAAPAPAVKPVLPRTVLRSLYLILEAELQRLDSGPIEPR